MSEHEPTIHEWEDAPSFREPEQRCQCGGHIYRKADLDARRNVLSAGVARCSRTGLAADGCPMPPASPTMPAQ